jgi:YHS domain-containing protein
MPAAPAAGAPVNTICAICGMPVNPKLPTATYQGKTIGFGCKACPPKFAAEPDRYGPAALKNQVVEE